MKKILSTNITGILVPLITPFYHGKFDKESMKRLMYSIEKDVDGFVPCLSSGEGSLLSEETWITIIQTVRSCTTKPVIAGIKKSKAAEIIAYAHRAYQLNCDAIIVPAIHKNEQDILKYFTDIAKRSPLPVIVYNTQKFHIHTDSAFLKLAQIKNIIGIKDSSGNQNRFDRMCKLKRSQALNIGLFQGLEHQLIDSLCADGFLISLANIAPDLCKKVFQKKEKRRSTIEETFYKYNLGGFWYVSLKAVLMERDIIRSSEEVMPIINS